MNSENVPDIIVSRLPVYLRALQRMADAGITTTSSQELGEKVRISAAQIRKDLSQFGEFGKQGTGYYIPFLIDRLRQILKVDRIWGVAVIGMGDIGHAIVRYQGFSNRGFRVEMCFDSDAAKIGQKVGEFVIRDVKDMETDIREAGIKVAMLAVPAAVAQDVADKLVAAGVQGILNYAPISLKVPSGVKSQHIDPAIGLQRITYYIQDK
jgi:redox-sensing transcriptional repressor